MKVGSLTDDRVTHEVEGHNDISRSVSQGIMETRPRRSNGVFTDATAPLRPQAPPRIIAVSNVP